MRIRSRWFDSHDGSEYEGLEIVGFQFDEQFHSAIVAHDVFQHMGLAPCRVTAPDDGALFPMADND